MASGKATIETHVSFAVPGDKIELHVRVGDNPAAGAQPIATAKVRKDGRVKFTGLEPGSYFMLGTVKVVRDGAEVKEQRSEAVNAKLAAAPDPDAARPGVHPSPVADPSLAAQLRSQTHKEIITGARSSSDVRARDARGHVPPADPLAHPEEAKLTSEKGAELASDTHAGVAVPASTTPLQQEDVPEGVQQASDTELGDATPLPGELERVAEKAAKSERDRKRRRARAAAAQKDAAAKKRSAASKKAAATRKRDAARRKK